MIVLASLAALLVAIALYVFYFRPRRIEALAAHDTVVLADFANATGDPIFDDTLKTALSMALQQSPFLNLLPENKVAETLQSMKSSPDSKLTPEVARNVCRKAGAKAYIAGSIAREGSAYAVALKATDCRAGGALATEQIAAPDKDKILDALGDLAAKMRADLGESDCKH